MSNTDDGASAKPKALFASPAWVAMARDALQDLAAQHGTEGTRFSVSETFFEAPAEIADADGFASWHFIVDGKKATVEVGRIEGADVSIQATWEVALENARLVYTPELFAQWEKNPPKPPDDPNLKIEGDRAGLPLYIAELHNMLAVVTA